MDTPLRKEFGVTQSDLASKMGVSRRTVVRWERGEIEKADPFRLEKLRQVMHRWRSLPPSPDPNHLDYLRRRMATLAPALVTPLDHQLP